MCLRVCVISVICQKVHPIKRLMCLCQHCLWLLHTRTSMIILNHRRKLQLRGHQWVTIDRTVVQIAKAEMHCLHILQSGRNKLWLLLCLLCFEKQWQCINEAVNSGCDEPWKTTVCRFSLFPFPFIISLVLNSQKSINICRIDIRMKGFFSYKLPQTRNIF